MLEVKPKGLHPRPASESDLIATLLAHFAGSGVVAMDVEVQSHGRARVDIAYFDGRDLVGVEAKLADWKRAIAQAVLNRVCFDRSYIALWHTLVSDAVVAEARRFGLGVLAVTKDTVDVAKPAPRAQPGATLRRAVLAKIREGNT